MILGDARAAERPARGWGLVLSLALAVAACDTVGGLDAATCAVRTPAAFAPFAGDVRPSAVPGVRTPGYLHADGARLVDHRGRTVRLTGVNWFGFETDAFVPHGLDRRGLGSLLDQVQRLGYNALRVPFANEMLDPRVHPAAGAIDFDHNPELVGLSSLEVLDRLIAEAGQRGLAVILDRHRAYASEAATEARGCTKDGPWYAEGWGEARWVRDWMDLAARYLGDPTVVGVDLSNEPDGSWGDDVPETDWRAAAERAGNAILAVNPELLIIVEGVGRHADFPYDHYWTGGNLAGVRSDPVRLAIPEQLVYSIHDYPASVTDQPWFASAAFPDDLPDVWEAAWGFIARDELAPILIGEFGSRLESSQDRLWLEHLMDYADELGASFTVWSLNPDSVDTGGLLEDDWRTVRRALQDELAGHLEPSAIR
ncbi:MAG: 1,4-beta-glucanase [Deltaproteobacteria bacterium HGW-Deltaproteobacteria-14]|nr:MAG: 1,4-beta-glucanase [Deltaproteobacteria bacterium HGW-Deltaproteobacteria-14]